MNELRSEQVNWTPDDMLEVKIKQPDDFLKIRETLTYTNKVDILSHILKNYLHLMVNQQV